MTTKYINLNQLSDKLGGRSQSSIYRDIDENRIPKPLKIGSRLYWIESAVDAALCPDATAKGFLNDQKEKPALRDAGLNK